jgi:hypothetical protein
MDAPPPDSVFLVFGDLHGKILPAVRLAAVWSREHETPLAGVLQVGDMGYFPDPNNIDKATLRHAKDDPLELGTFDIVETNPLADAVFDDPHSPPGLWFTAGNHEDFDVLERLARASGDQSDFAVDAYGRIRGIKDGAVMPFACGLQVGAIWGVDGGGPNARQNLPKRGYIWEKSVSRLLHTPFDVLLCHDAPLGARWVSYGSRDLKCLIELAQPTLAFFGHYSGDGSKCDTDYGRTAVYHMAGLELGGKDGTPKSGSVGVLRWGEEPTFEYVPDEWLRTFSRHNWKWR